VVAMVWPGEKEPEYQGKKLSAWLVEYPFMDREPESIAEQNAVDAVRHIGTNALPYLLRWMRYERPAWRNTLYTLLRKLPSNGPLRVAGRPDILAGCTPYAFKSLGAAVMPAVPELVRLMSDRKAPDVGRANAMWVLTNLGSNGLPAVPILIGCLRDKDAFVTQQAAFALGRIGLEPDLVVPALANCLKDPRAEVREQAVRSLACYGKRAVPVLREAQVGAGDEFRRLIAGTLEVIAMHASNAVQDVLTNGVMNGGPSP